MKKRIFAILVVLSLCIGLYSCKFIKDKLPPRTSEDVWDLISEKMDSQNSYTIKAKADFKFKVDNIEIIGKLSGETVIVDVLGDDFYFYQSMKSEVGAKSSKVSETSNEILAYESGVAYLHRESGSNFKNLSADMSAEEFFKFYSDDSISLSPEKSNDSSFVKKEDGSWYIKCSDFEDDYIRSVCSSVGLGSLIFTYGINIEDISFEVFANSEYYVNLMKLAFLDGEGEDIISMDMEYSSFNSTEKRSFDKKNYTKVDDITIVDKINDSLAETLSYDSGSFVLDVEHTIDGKDYFSTIIDETDKVSYKIEDGKLTFKIDIKDGSISYNIEYEDGAMKTYQGSGEPVVRKYSEKEARLFLAALVNNFGYNSLYVDNVIKIDEDEYKIKCRAEDVSAYRQLITAYGDSYKGYDLEFIAKVDKDGNIKEIKSVLTAYGINISYKIVNKLDISK